MWLAAEWQRRPPRVPGGGAQPPFGQDVAAAIWITFSPTLGKVATKAAKWITPLRDKTPMAFLYGEDDKRAASIATELCEQILKIDTPPRPKYTGAKAIKGKGVGQELLQKSAETDEKILNYLTNVLDARGDQPWVNRDTKRAKFDFVQLKQFFK